MPQVRKRSSHAVAGLRSLTDLTHEHASQRVAWSFHSHMYLITAKATLAALITVGVVNTLFKHSYHSLSFWHRTA